MRPAGLHLTPQEMELLLFGPADPRNSKADDAEARDAQQHLSQCAVCQSVAEKYRKADEMLRTLRSGNKDSRSQSRNDVSRGPDCPVEETWLSLAAGLLPDEKAANHVAHAATCSWCTSLLKEAMEDQAYDVTAAEQEALAQLPTTSLEWQRQMAMKLAAQHSDDQVRHGQEPEAASESDNAHQISSDKDKQANTGGSKKDDLKTSSLKTPALKPPGFHWPKLAWVSAVASLILAGGLFVWLRQTSEPDVNKLLAQAYTQQRTIELRIPGAEYSASKVQRGEGLAEMPKEFHQAEAIIQDHLSKHPEDAIWLQAQARADLLQWHYESANHRLDEALNIRPDDPELLFDKAIALYERAKRNPATSGFDYGEAAENLSKVLQVRPDLTVVLFNRAIIYEELFHYDVAVADWERYLKLDPTGPWADEAKDHLQRLKKKIQILRDSLNQPLVKPGAFVALAHDPAGMARLDERIEQYQDAAITEWVVEAYSPNESPELRTDAAAALHELGKILETGHGDSWLNDLLSSDTALPAYLAGLVSLRDAHLKSAESYSEDAARDAARAIKSFTAARSIPGRVRAEAELIYALQRSQKGKECLAEVQKIEPELAVRAYAWLQGQVDIDRAGCSLKLGNFAEARSAASRSIELSLRNGFAISRLRGVGMACSVETLAGNYVTAWGLCEEGLDEYWNQAETSPVAAHSCYDLLAQMSENMHWFNLALNFAQHSILTASGRPNIQVLTRQHMAKIALNAGLPSVARGALAEASTLMESPKAKEKMSAANRVYGEVMLADVEMKLGMLLEAETRLNSLNPPASTALSIKRSLYRSKGELLALQKRNNEAEAEFFHAIQEIATADSQGQEITDPIARQVWNEENSEIYRALVMVEIERGDLEKALAVSEWYRSAESRRTKIASSLNEFLGQKGLQPLIAQLNGQTLLSYFLAPQGLVIWVVDQNGVRSQFIPLNAPDLVKQVFSFSTMCADRDSDLVLLKIRGRRFFDTFIAPIATDLAANRPVIIESDELLQDLPFQAFVTPEGHYLSQDYTLVFSPGLFYLANERSAARLSPLAKAVIVASTANAADESLSLQPDDNVVPEGFEIASRFVHPVFLKRTDATREKIRSALGKQEILHFASHGFSNIWREGLLIYSSQSGDKGAELWGARDFDPELFKQTRLVVLSACSTGRALQTRRESHGRMVRALLSGGVPHVIATSWDVDSGKTRTLMGFFYDSILSGESFPSALRHAQVEMINNDATSHPYYWAALMAFGRA